MSWSAISRWHKPSVLRSDIQESMESRSTTGDSHENSEKHSLEWMFSGAWESFHGVSCGVCWSGVAMITSFNYYSRVHHDKSNVCGETVFGGSFDA